MNAVTTQWSDTAVAVMQYNKSIVSRLQGSLLKDALGRVVALVNYRAIEEAQLNVEDVERIIDNPPLGSVMYIDYVEEIPTIYGVPIWEKLEGEDLTFYELFKKYRSMRKDHSTLRSIYRLSVETGVEVSHLNLLRQLFHWSPRSSAYDTYMEQERQVALTYRQQEIEGRHSSVAAELFAVGSSYLKEHREMLTPKTAIQMIEVAAKLERLSAGMADAKSFSNGTPQINISNNLASNGSSITNNSASAIISDDAQQNKDRLRQVLNIMNEIGVLQPEVIEEEVDDSIID